MLPVPLNTLAFRELFKMFFWIDLSPLARQLIFSITQPQMSLPVTLD